MATPIFRIKRTGRVFDSVAEKRHYPWVMGILNVNSDSFSDGGDYNDSESAIAHALEMLRSGADIIDIGAESTRPGAKELDSETEVANLLPVVSGLRAIAPEAVISVDTRKAAVAKILLEAGVDIINDVSGLSYDSDMASVVAAYEAGLCIMHMRGVPENMQSPENLIYDDLLNDVSSFLLNAREKAIDAGVAFESIMLDPGIGFSKTAEQNMMLIHHAEAFNALGSPVLYGVSRKTFLGKLAGVENPADRDYATCGILTYLTAKNVSFVRVHNVTAAVDSMKIYSLSALE